MRKTFTRAALLCCFGLGLAACTGYVDYDPYYDDYGYDSYDQYPYGGAYYAVNPYWTYGWYNGSYVAYYNAYYWDGHHYLRYRHPHVWNGHQYVAGTYGTYWNGHRQVQYRHTHDHPYPPTARARHDARGGAYSRGGGDSGYRSPEDSWKRMAAN